MDAYDVVRTSLGPALEALDNSGKTKIAIAQMASNHAFEMAKLDREQQFRRGELEKTYQLREHEATAQRTGTREDLRAEEQHKLEMSIAALGGDVRGKTREQKEKQLHDLQTKDIEDRLQEKTDAELHVKAKDTGVDPTLPRPEMIAQIAKKQGDTARALTSQNELADVAQAKADPRFPAIAATMGKLLAERGSIMAQWVMPVPQLNPGLTPGDEMLMGQKMAQDSGVLDALKKVPGGDGLLRILQTQGAQAFFQNKALTPTASTAVMMRMEAIAPTIEKEINTNKDIQASMAMRSYLAKVQRMPADLARIDADIQYYENMGEGLKNGEKGVRFGLALRGEDRDKLIHQAIANGPGNMPGTGAGQDANTDNRQPGTTQLPPDVVGGSGAPGAGGGQGPGAGMVAPREMLTGPPPRPQQPAGDFLGSPTGMPLSLTGGSEAGAFGPPAPYQANMRALIQRKKDLELVNGRDYSDSVMHPMYAGAAQALGVQPQRLGGSSLVRNPGAILQNNPLLYDQRFTSLPDDVKNQVVLDALRQSYDNPTYQTPWLDWSVQH